MMSRFFRNFVLLEEGRAGKTAKKEYMMRNIYVKPAMVTLDFEVEGMIANSLGVDTSEGGDQILTKKKNDSWGIDWSAGGENLEEKL